MGPDRRGALPRGGRRQAPRPRRPPALHLAHLRVRGAGSSLRRPAPPGSRNREDRARPGCRRAPPLVGPVPRAAAGSPPRRRAPCGDGLVDRARGRSSGHGPPRVRRGRALPPGDRGGGRGGGRRPRDVGGRRRASAGARRRAHRGGAAPARALRGLPAHAHGLRRGEARARRFALDRGRGAPRGRSRRRGGLDVRGGLRRLGVRRGLEGLHPLLPAWTTEFAYGRVLARGALDLPTRELLAVAILAALGRCDDALLGHMRAAARLGASRESIAGAIAVVPPTAGAGRRAAARALLERLAP